MHFYFLRGEGASEMAPWVKVLATKPGSLNLNPKSHIKIEGENPLHEIVL